MRKGLRIDRYAKIVLTLIVVLLAALLCKPLFLARPVTAYNTTADDAYYHADEAYYLAEEALEKAKKAYSYADSAYYRVEEAYQKAEESYSEASREAYTAKSRAEEAYDKAIAANNASWRVDQELSNLVTVVGFLIRKNREGLIKIGERLEITVSSLEDLQREFEKMREREE
ncbi:hypothetical protein ES702_03024 [subsurface metagenome]